ncbi:cell number regulator 6-like [Henckelia pumila]|uniref:cell number regulator 6-like n=1 Tax=Henckelia pumila TaxID=405737 RepID=UPI003C6DBC34
MADGVKYVKLKENQAPLEKITAPGERYQSVDVPQPSPERFPDPEGEPWTTGIFECAQDTESCMMGLFCPCVLFGRNVAQVRDNCTWIAPCIFHAVYVEGGVALAAAFLAGLQSVLAPRTSGCILEVLVFGWMMSGLCTSTVRDSLEERYLLERWPCDACVVHSYAHWCAICQEHRELKARLAAGDADIPMIMLSPPPVQEMNAANVEVRAL